MFKYQVTILVQTEAGSLSSGTTYLRANSLEQATRLARWLLPEAASITVEWVTEAL